MIWIVFVLEIVQMLVMLVLCNNIICITQSLTYSVLASQDHQSLPDSPEAGQLLCLRAKPLTFSTWKGYSNFFWNWQAQNMFAAYYIVARFPNPLPKASGSGNLANYIAAYLSLHAFSWSLHNWWLRVRFSYMRAWVWTWVMKNSWLQCRQFLLNENHLSVWDCLPCRNILTIPYLWLNFISLIPSVVYKKGKFSSMRCVRVFMVAMQTVFFA